MQALRSTIQDYLALQLGGPGKTKKGLAGELKTISRANEKYLFVCSGMLVALFVVSLVLILVCRNQPAYLTAVASFTGVSVFGGIKKMHNLWREKVATDIVLAMADYYPEDEFRLFVQGFFDRVFRPAAQLKPERTTATP
jgi:hypothetical protein